MIEILSAERVKTSPENLGVELSHDKEAVRLSPVLYNRKDYVQFKLLLSGYKTMQIDARIVGVSVIRKSKKRNDLLIANVVDYRTPNFLMTSSVC